MLKITLYICHRRRHDLKKMRHEVALLMCTQRVIPSRILGAFVRGPLPKRQNDKKVGRWMTQNAGGFSRIVEDIQIRVQYVSAAADERVEVEQIFNPLLRNVDILTYSGERNSRLADGLPDAIAMGMDALPKTAFTFISPERRSSTEAASTSSGSRENYIPAHHMHRVASRAAV